MTPSLTPLDLTLPITLHRSLGASHFLLELATPPEFPTWTPGQFAMITTGSPDGPADPLLRRPFSIYNLPGSPAGSLQILYKVLGRGTDLLTRVREGAALGCLAPLGNGFSPVRPDGTRLLLVAGGIGSASLHPLAISELNRGGSPLMLYGCRTAADMAGIKYTQDAGVEILVATDDGTQGRHGFVSEMLDETLTAEGENAARRWVICACGPTPMMKATATVAARHGVRCYLSLESPMACGFGVCVGCVVSTKESPEAPLRYRRICVEGPVFDAARVYF